MTPHAPNVTTATSSTSARPYGDFDRLPIAGTWREGRSGYLLSDRNPYNGSVLVQTPQGNNEDLDASFEGAAKAQAAWAAELSSTRADVMRRAAAGPEARRAEIISWLIREAGSTRLKAKLEWASSHAILIWGASAPDLVEGRNLPTDIRGKEGRVHRKPVGVVGVISPWNWALHFSSRSIVPALAVGNAVVVKPASDTPVTGGLLLAKIFEDAGLPPGVLSVIVGAGSDSGEAFVTLRRHGSSPSRAQRPWGAGLRNLPPRRRS